jgi:hypothetical protein
VNRDHTTGYHVRPTVLRWLRLIRDSGGLDHRLLVNTYMTKHWPPKHVRRHLLRLGLIEEPREGILRITQAGRLTLATKRLP